MVCSSRVGDFVLLIACLLFVVCLLLVCCVCVLLIMPLFLLFVVFWFLIVVVFLLVVGCSSRFVFVRALLVSVHVVVCCLFVVCWSLSLCMVCCSCLLIVVDRYASFVV